MVAAAVAGEGQTRAGVGAVGDLGPTGPDPDLV